MNYAGINNSNILHTSFLRLMQFQLMQISDSAATIFRWPSINAHKISISAQTHRMGNLIYFILFSTSQMAMNCRKEKLHIKRKGK